MKPLHYACIYNFCIEKNYNLSRRTEATEGNKAVLYDKGYVLNLLLETRPEVS